jgi:hypothetical protein
LALQVTQLLCSLVLGQNSGLFFVDSCPLEVCHIKRASSHKVAADIASQKKSSMGWFFGFKLLNQKILF